MKKIFIFVIIFAVTLGFSIEKTNREKILEDPEWENIYSEYKIEDAYIETLESRIGEKLSIEVYLAFWCGDSKENVPIFLKIIDQIDPNRIIINYYSVDRKPNRDVKYFVEDLKVERVPTFIFYRDGQEIGRIIEQPKLSMIEDFLEIIFSQGFNKVSPDRKNTT
jgi:thiol-disulfide isomerase/thioredoxin